MVILRNYFEERAVTLVRKEQNFKRRNRSQLSVRLFEAPGGTAKQLIIGCYAKTYFTTAYFLNTRLTETTVQK